MSSLPRVAKGLACTVAAIAMMASAAAAAQSNGNHRGRNVGPTAAQSMAQRPGPVDEVPVTGNVADQCVGGYRYIILPNGGSIPLSCGGAYAHYRP